MARFRHSRPRGNLGLLNPDAAVEWEVMSNEQTFRSEDNAFLPLRRRQLSVRCVTTQSKWNGEPSTKKDFEAEQPVSSLLPVRPSLIFQLRNPV